MQYIFVLLILGVSNTLSFGNNSTGNSTTLTFQESQATTNRTSRTFNPQGEEQDATSSSPTYLSNEKNDQMRKSVLETLNSEIPELSQAPNQYDRVLSQQKTPVYHQQQPSEFQAPQSFSFTDAEGSKVNYYPRYPGGHNRETQRQGDESSAGKVFPVQAGVPLFNAAQRRTDEEGEYAQETNYPEDSYSSDSQRINSEQSGQSEFQQGQPPPRQPELEKPETRQGFFPEFPLSGPGFVGPAAFDPLPPPPPPLKGSVDYILIPLILIGLAGPIFVVLYVILGAFEAKLSPITRSLGGMGSYQPYLDTLMSSVGRALDKSDCWEYTACQVGNFCNTLGYTEDLPLKRALEKSLPGKYKKPVRKLFTSMKKQRDCQLRSCLKF